MGNVIKHFDVALKEEIITCPSCDTQQETGYRHCLNCGYDFNKDIVYISGAITGIKNFKDIFNTAETVLKAKGNEVINPAKIQLHESATHEDYMAICYEQIKMADTIYMLKDWGKSKGACIEYGYARGLGKNIIEEGQDEN